ncbi:MULTISPECIES: hypothetical protein [Mucilaginibacter]|uniref:Uncharacterized protein n=1 Tax=Mucilaginibacter rubeus TaxID=2027860 RepID=A0ABX7UFC2_9SPHI|nr:MULTISPECIES: hypothetical protein [Mucilaginibacter]QTE44886.1 hypothetical protein J3L19_05820 [Mucilaginibacter rubeus]QTE51484.1 hypothetical protein J3L21_05795 [Mucilaginibacter rubeus]QTE56570.1 hypothetical protein J3L23_31040 [Mucilaginibacter rubeus]QTE63968.1 hypothetical protein J3L22_02790 [Mucilaginibacter rubeus]QTF62727.1 hypothetical protein J3L20_02470 [Mucilaginibacter rubeus]
MKTEKLSLKSIKNVLSRSEMKKLWLAVAVGVVDVEAVTLFVAVFSEWHAALD